MVKKNSSLGQISIFIILSISIIFLLSFLIFSNFETKKNNLENSKSAVEPTIKDLRFIKDRFDYCLNLGLKKATIVSGLRGGLIYSKNESYMSGTIPIGTYDHDLLTKSFNLNWNSLKSRTLINYDVIQGFPLYNSTNVITYPIDDDTNNNIVEYNFTHSIEEDFNKFIIVEFYNCLNLKQFEQEGYLVDYEKFTSKGFIIDEPNQNIITKNLDVKLGDSIEVLVDGREIIGNVISIKNLSFPDTNQVSIRLSSKDLENLSSNQERDSINLLNLNSSIQIETFFKTEEIGAQLKYPVIVKKGNLNLKIENIYSSINIRFKKMYELASKLLYLKSFNKSINLINKSFLNKIFSDDPYFKKSGYSDIKLLKTIIFENEQQKKFIYSLIDSGSKILGDPFVLNFGYKNKAPMLDFSLLPRVVELDGEGSAVILCSIDTLYTSDLHNIVFERQYMDNYKNVRFKKKSIHNSEVDFELSETGILNFTPHLDKIFSFEISVTDGEATTIKTLTFLTGVVNNKNNKEAIHCLNFHPGYSGSFPIESEFSGLNEIIVGSEHIVYGHQIYSDIIDETKKPSKSRIHVGVGCLAEYANLFHPIITISYGEDGVEQDITSSYNPLTRNIILPYPTKFSVPMIVKIGLVDSSNNLIFNPPYTLKIYPAKCLGPRPFLINGEPTDEEISQNSDYDNLGGDFSCCDFSSLPEIGGTPKPEKYDNLENNGNPIDTDYYASLLIDKKVDRYGTLFNFGEKSLWDEFGNEITSIYKGHLKATCNGKYPNAMENLDYFGTGNNLNYPITNYYLGGQLVDISNLNLNLSVEEITPAKKICLFPNLANNFMKIKTSNNLLFNLAFTDGNNENDFDNPSKSYFISSNWLKNNSYDDLKILAENTIYSSYNNVELQANPSFNFGKDNFKKFSIGKNYCYTPQSCKKICDPEDSSYMQNPPGCYSLFTGSSSNFYKYVGEYWSSDGDYPTCKNSYYIGGYDSNSIKTIDGVSNYDPEPSGCNSDPNLDCTSFGYCSWP